MLEDIIMVHTTLKLRKHVTLIYHSTYEYFYCSKSSSWVTQMEHYFFLHGIIDDMMKLIVGVLCWIKSDDNHENGIKILFKLRCLELVFEIHLFSYLQRHSVFGKANQCISNICALTNFITTSKQLVIYTKGSAISFYIECFIRGLVEEIKDKVLMHHPSNW